MTQPSSHMIPKHRSFPDPWSARLYSSSFHSFRTARGSLSHGLELTMAFMKALTPPMLFAMGPNTEGIESWPSSELTAPQYGIRPHDGLRPCRPQNAEGARIDLLGSSETTTGSTSRFHTRQYQNRLLGDYLSGQSMQPLLQMTHPGSRCGCMG